MNPLYAIILGLVEGVSEWLPISSKTQTPSRYCPTRGWANCILIATSTAAVVGIVVISYLLKFAKTSRIYVIDFVLGAIVLVVGIIVTLFAPQSSPALSWTRIDV